jgi:hypothetical protein
VVSSLTQVDVDLDAVGLASVDVRVSLVTVSYQPVPK